MATVAAPKKIAARTRFFILQRDNFRCQYCGASPASEGVKLHVDHIDPKSKGGSHDNSNLITACNDCNLGKGNIEIFTNGLRQEIDDWLAVLKVLTS